MNRARKARLAAGGWKVGSAAEFLGLSKEEAAFIEMKLDLARCLREFRIKRKLSQARVADLLGSSQSRVAKMESGDPSVSVDLLLRSVLAVGASPSQVARALGSRNKLVIKPVRQEYFNRVQESTAKVMRVHRGTLKKLAD